MKPQIEVAIESNMKIMHHVRSILELMPVNPDSEGLADTPFRVATMYKELLAGYHQNPEDVLTTFTAEGYDELILAKDIPVYSLCEHHMLPFVGVAHIGYIPTSGVCVGLSKLPRIVDIFARRLQMQERLTHEITIALQKHLEPQGVICVIEAEHFCVTMRGVRAPGSKTVTSKVTGVFAEDTQTRAEALALIREGR